MKLLSVVVEHAHIMCDMLYCLLIVEGRKFVTVYIFHLLIVHGCFQNLFCKTERKKKKVRINSQLETFHTIDGWWRKGRKDLFTYYVTLTNGLIYKFYY